MFCTMNFPITNVFKVYNSSSIYVIFQDDILCEKQDITYFSKCVLYKVRLVISTNIWM